MEFRPTELEKKMSPSEAGRYAAEMRWRTHSGMALPAGASTVSLPDRLNRATDNMLAKGGSVSHLGVDESDAVLRGAMMMVERTFSEARMNQRDYELNVHAQKSWQEARKDPSAMLHVVRVGRNIAAVAVTVRPNDATVEIRHLSSTGVLKGAGSALLGSIIKKGVTGGRTTFRVTPSEESKSFWDEYGFSGAVYDQLGNPDGSQDLVVKPEWLRVVKAMSRSEAGKIAAEARWKNHVPATDATSAVNYTAPIGYQSDRIKGMGRRGTQSVTKGWRTRCSCGEIISSTGSSFNAHKTNVQSHLDSHTANVQTASQGKDATSAVAPSSAPSVPKKIATKQGIGRTLNDAGIRKTGYTYSSMVRGYSTQYSGWKSEETENGFKVNWVQSHQSSWGSRGKTPEQIAEHDAQIAGHVETAVKKIFDALTAKGYDTSMDGQTILINNERNG